MKALGVGQPGPKVFLDVLEKHASEFPEQDLLRTETEHVSYRAATELANRAANTYREIGVGRGDHCLLMLDNGTAWIPAWWGLAKLGAVEVPVNTAFRGEMLRYVIEDSDARVLVTEERFLDRLVEIADGLTKLKIVLVRRPPGDEALGEPDARLRKFALLSFGVLSEGGATFVDQEIRVSDVAAIMYTSGTTGRSKGVIAPYGQIYTNSDLPALGLLGQGETILMHLPMFHIGAQWHGFIGSVIAGGTFALGGQFHASQFLDEVRRFQAHSTCLVASMANFIYRQPLREDDADNPLRFVECSPAIKEFREFEKRFDVKTVVSYGLTEGGTLISSFGPKDHTMCGRARSDEFELSIVDEQDQPVPDGQTGELVARAKTPWNLMLGYYKQPTVTIDAYRNQWLHTGDLFRRNASGDYFFVDRTTDSIRRRGENISSAEVEAEVGAHPDVLECAAVPYPSEEGEDEVRVFVVARPGSAIDPTSLIRFVAARAPYFMVPRFVDVRTTLPRTETGKVRKELLREEPGVPAWDRHVSGITVSR